MHRTIERTLVGKNLRDVSLFRCELKIVSALNLFSLVCRILLIDSDISWSAAGNSLTFIRTRATHHALLYTRYSPRYCIYTISIPSPRDSDMEFSREKISLLYATTRVISVILDSTMKLFIAFTAIKKKKKYMQYIFFICKR